MDEQTVSVVICTLDRPALLADAVRSARAQALPAGYAAELVVVDNSPDHNAAGGLAALAAEPGWPLVAVSVREPNIAAARNAGVAAAAGGWIAFLDDDEWAEPGWLAALLATARATAADVVFGAVIADFPDGRPEWEPSGRSFERRLPLPDGAAMGLRHDRTLSGRWIGTGNSLLRRAACLGAPAPFDPALGRSGGEDMDLFTRLEADGRRMAWCGSAVVHEVVPGARIGLDYMLRRGRRGGQLWATIRIRHARRPRAAALSNLLRAGVQAAVLGAAALGARATRRPMPAARRLRLAQVRGRLAWRDLPQAYF